MMSETYSQMVNNKNNYNRKRKKKEKKKKEEKEKEKDLHSGFLLLQHNT